MHARETYPTDPKGAALRCKAVSATKTLPLTLLNVLQTIHDDAEYITNHHGRQEVTSRARASDSCVAAAVWDALLHAAKPPHCHTLLQNVLLLEFMPLD